MENLALIILLEILFVKYKLCKLGTGSSEKQNACNDRGPGKFKISDVFVSLQYGVEDNVLP